MKVGDSLVERVVEVCPSTISERFNVVSRSGLITSGLISSAGGQFPTYEAVVEKVTMPIFTLSFVRLGVAMIASMAFIMDSISASRTVLKRPSPLTSPTSVPGKLLPVLPLMSITNKIL